MGPSASGVGLMNGLVESRPVSGIFNGDRLLASLFLLPSAFVDIATMTDATLDASLSRLTLFDSASSADFHPSFNLPEADLVLVSSE